ncbi:MAG: peptidase C39 [Lachnospiraceae bacterium]|jgi:hypothetical protein|nr:peptidase C39 [Lachnospiraceae bacterium]
MKIPLRYQVTEYDCGQTAIMNALCVLFGRQEIPPEIPAMCQEIGGDLYNTNGQPSRFGTSCAAMQYIACWLNNYADSTKYPIRVVHIGGRRVNLQPDSTLTACLREGGTAVVRCMLGCAHYITLTGIDEKRRLVYAFDGYYREKPFTEPGIEMVPDRPRQYNRILAFDVLDRKTKGSYSLYHEDLRDATLFYRTACEGRPKFHAFR